MPAIRSAAYSYFAYLADNKRIKIHKYALRVIPYLPIQTMEIIKF